MGRALAVVRAVPGLAGIMSDAAIAVTAIIVSGVQVTAVVGAGAWLIHHKRILFAATPKPPAQDAAKTRKRGTPEQPQADERPISILGGESRGEVA